MIQLTAKCKLCNGSRDDPLDTSTSRFLRHLPCPDCNGKGMLIFDDTKWEITLERVPPFSLEEKQAGMIK